MEKSDCFSLIDENDSLISPDADDAADLTHLHSELERVESIGDLSADSKCSEQLPQLLETTEPDIQKKKGKLNLRKSLAWNSAFFESPGFLDADEISTIIDGAEKGKKQLLPGIDEDISRSSESISTLASDNLALESLENELFKDIRASIQKSSISASNRKAAPKETDKLVKRSVKKEDITSRNGIATNVTSIRQSRGMLGSARISKKDSSSALVKQAGFRNGKSSSSLPQLPKVIPKPEAMPAVTTKRAVLGANRIKTETNKSKVGGKVQVHVPVTTGLDNPRRSVSRPASLQKAPGLASSNAAKKEVGRSSSSSNNSNSTFTEKIQKSTSISGTTKKPSKPIIQASSKIPLSRKAPSKSGLPATLTSSKISSSISPSSSISEWSSASSRTSIDTNSSRRSMDSETPSIMCSDVQSNDGILDGILNQFKESPSQDMKINNAQTKVVSRSLMMKPSGLRMPSPKIGFFDGLEGQKVDSPKLSHESASFGMSPEHQSCLSTGSPKIKAPRHSPVGILKKAEGNTPTGTQTTEGANTVLDKSESATPETLQESTGELMKGLGDHRSVLSVDISSEVTNSVEAARNPCSEIKLASTKSELESQKADSPQLFHESASFGMSPGQPTGLPKIRNAIHSPVGSSKKAEGRSPVGTKTPEGANTALEKLESATSELSQESTGDLMKDHGNHRSLLSLDISSEVMSSVEVTRIPCSEMALTSTNIELEGQNSYFPEPFQKNGFGLSPEQELCLPTGLPKTGAASCNTVGSLKKGEFLAGEKATVGATVLHTPKPTPEPSQESLSALMEGNGDPWKLNTNESSEARSPNMGSGKPWSKITLTSTNIELEGQKADSPVPFGQSASPGVSPEILSETDRSNCGMAEDVKIRKHQSAEWANMSDEENNENLLFII
ncbi:hypothetical protein DCAR_0415862 [Daucus carota subsp. sativus]|uniref:Uncharacterized protein n=1 Tax=Daucus carota subsp. sativus TaxID=79200 RepID=A0AAF1AXS9_DAUCS|nr:hypothetical protein DCAR_0415862 [Daucus carota subsp. sativus]